MSDSVRPHRLQPTRLPRPWDSPGKNTGVGCHFLLQCIKVKSESEVAHRAPPSMGFSKQEYWSGVPLPSPSSLLECKSAIHIIPGYLPKQCFTKQHRVTQTTKRGRKDYIVQRNDTTTSHHHHRKGLSLPLKLKGIKPVIHSYLIQNNTKLFNNILNNEKLQMRIKYF